MLMIESTIYISNKVGNSLKNKKNSNNYGNKGTHDGYILLTIVY